MKSRVAKKVVKNTIREWVRLGKPAHTFNLYRRATWAQANQKMSHRLFEQFFNQYVFRRIPGE